jgi:large subunit ribosomal protein L32
MVVRMRHTRAHTANRRSHHALKGGALTTDTKTGVVHLRHRASIDGTYKGRSVLGDPVKKVMKKQGKKVVAKKPAKKAAKKKVAKKK